MTDFAACRSSRIGRRATRAPETGAIAQAFVAEVARELRSVVRLGATETIPSPRCTSSPAEIRTGGGRPRPRGGRTRNPPGIAMWPWRAHMPRGGAIARRSRATTRCIMMRAEFRKFVDRSGEPDRPGDPPEGRPHPHGPRPSMSELGVFGLTIPEAYGGLGLGKIAMCVVTEELSRGYIGVGSLGHARGDRSGADPAAAAPRRRRRSGSRRSRPATCSPRRSSPSRTTAPTSRTSRRAQHGARTEAGASTGRRRWITHACGADLMTLLARTNPAKPDYGGLSMFLRREGAGQRERRVRRTRGSPEPRSRSSATAA